MAGFSHNDDKERVRQAVDIVDLVGDYLTLHRAGRDFKALCPWHDDSRPSLTINPERQSFRCWVCDIGGDVFSFAMRMEGVGFREALEMLADRAGVALSAAPRTPRADAGAPAPVGIDEKRTLLQVTAWAEQLYHDYLLNDPAAESARQYLAERGIAAESLAEFHLGFAPPAWDWLLTQARQTRFTVKQLELAGLVVPRSGGPGHYDRFRGRVLFSIRDPQARPVALGGRLLPGVGDVTGAKYINSPETPLFNKSEMLYALDVARPAIKQAGSVLVMEGYTDVIVAHQAGFKNAVAVLGTALGERHIRRILRGLTQQVVLVLDGDEAGRRRTDEILELFVSAGLDLRILTLPENLDPCDFLLRQGAEPFRRLLDGAVDALEHKFLQETNGLGTQSGVHQVSQAVENVITTIGKAPRPTLSADRLREDQMLHRLSQLSGLREERLRERLTEVRSAAKSRPTPQPSPNEEFGGDGSHGPIDPAPPPVSAKQRLAESELLEILVQCPECMTDVRPRVTIEQFVVREHRALYVTMCRLYDAGVVSACDRLMLEIDDPNLQSLVVRLDDTARARKRDDRADELEKLVAVLDEAWRRNRAELAGDTTHAKGGANLSDLQRIIQRARSRQGISTPTDG